MKVKNIKNWLINLVWPHHNEKLGKIYKCFDEYIILPKKKYSLIFILATDIERCKRKEKCNFKFKEVNEEGALDKGFRFLATQHLYEAEKLKRFVLVGGCNGKLGKWRTEVMKEYLLKKYHIPKHRLEELHCCPGNTCGNIKEIIWYLKDNKDWRNEPFGIITNWYHIPRTWRLFEKMLSKSKEFSDQEKRKITNSVEFIPAEMIIKNKGKKKEIREIKDFYSNNNGAMKERIKAENRGIKEILDVKKEVYGCGWCGESQKNYKRWFQCVACVILYNSDRKILLGKRREEPEKGKWAILGGSGAFEKSKNLRDFAVREVKYDIGIEVDPKELKHFWIIFKQNQDSLIIENYFYYEVGKNNNIRTTDDYKAPERVEWFSIKKITKKEIEGQIAFNNYEVINKFNKEILSKL